MTSKHLRLLAGALLALVLVAAGCGDDGDDSSSDDTTTTTEAEETTEPAAVEGATEDAEDITEPVTEAFTTFFHNFEGDPALLERGDEFAEGIEGLRATAAAAGTIDVVVKDVAALPDEECESVGTIAPCAEVTFDLAVADDPAAVPDQTGYAVYVDGEWQVSAATFCALTAMGSGPPDAC